MQTIRLVAAWFGSNYAFTKLNLSCAGTLGNLPTCRTYWHDRLTVNPIKALVSASSAHDSTDHGINKGLPDVAKGQPAGHAKVV